MTDLEKAMERVGKDFERQFMCKDGGPAFPSWEEVSTGVYHLQGGMSLRDYFAAAALSGIHGWFGDTPIEHPVAAKIAYDVADAMLVERAK